MSQQVTDRPPTPSDHPASNPDAIAAAHGKVLRPTPELAEAMSRGYEPKDISLRGLFIFLGTLVATLVVVLLAIYAIMMALVEHDRSHDPRGTTVSIQRPEVYAPVQPSIGHATEDWEDMNIMREQTWATLNSAGVTPTGRRTMTIGDAVDTVVSKLVIGEHPVDTGPKNVAEQPANSYEGFIPSKDRESPAASIYPEVGRRSRAEAE